MEAKEVFICYRGNSQVAVSIGAQIHTLLEYSTNIQCFYAPYTLKKGDEFKSILPEIFKTVKIVILLLSKDFFNDCVKDDDIVLAELKEALKNVNIKFLPIVFMNFNYCNEDLSIFSQAEIDRFKHINAFEYYSPYSFDFEKVIQTVCNLLGKTYSNHISASNGDSQQYSLNSKIPQVRDIFVGRDAQLREMREFFDSGKRILFLEGIAGIGKSELAKQYALMSRDKYENIIFTTYSNDLQTLVCDPNMIEINGMEIRPEESRMEFFRRKMNIFRGLTGKKTLLIVDNFDVDSDLYLTEFLDGSHDIIITTRNSHPGYHSIKIHPISDRNLLFDMFEKHYGMTVCDEDKPYLQELFQAVDYHTYTIELLAKQMEASFSSAKDLLEIYKNGRLATDATEALVGRNSTNTAFGHISALFSMSNLSEDEIHVLRELSLVGNAGIPANIYWDWIGSDNINLVKKVTLSLIKKSWIRRESTGNGESFSLHPLVSEVVRTTEISKPNATNCRKYLLKVSDYIYEAWYRPVKENMAVSDCILSLAEYFEPFEFDHDDRDLFCVWVMLPSFLWQVGRFDDSIRLGHVVYNSTLSVCGKSSMLTGFAAKSLGGCYFNSGRIEESIEWYKNGLESMILANEGDSEDLALSYEKVARCYTWPYEQDFLKAEELFFEAEQMRTRMKQCLLEGRQIRSVERQLILDVSTVEERIGENYLEIGRMYQLKEDYEKALEFALKQEEIISRIAPDNLSGMAYVYYDKGVCLYHLAINARNHLDEAKALKYLESSVENLRMALDLNIKMRGNIALDTINNQEYLGDAYVALRKSGEASNCYISVISMVEKLFGSDNERIATVKSKMLNLK